MCTFAELSEIAYKKEKSASLRLAQRLGMSTETALTEVLSKVAEGGSLNCLLYTSDAADE